MPTCGSTKPIATARRTTLATPLTVFGGQGDSRASEEELLGWHLETTGRFASHMYPGGHFFLSQHAGRVLDIIRKELS